MDENPNSLFGHALDVSEGSFGRWSELPTHLKIEVLRNVPFPTLRSFMFVSKECLALVLLMKPEPTGCYVGSAVIEIRYYTRRCCTGKASLSALAFSFEVDEDGGSVVSRIVKKEDPSLDKIGAHYSDEPLSSAFRVFVQFARTLTVSKLKIVLKTAEQVIGELPTAPPLSCQQLIIHTEDPAVPPLLFRFVSPGTKLCIRSYEDVYVGDVSLESSVFDSEVVRAAPSFESVIATRITDHQLPLLRGEVLYLIAPGVTSKGINRLIWGLEKGLFRRIGAV
ncbi:F-box domain protein [Oesophagostomum dentatum]|uniref:F-box domain protein n=1 Tax=Oesophagostomum dentatum TaxID=61180 RepID=A0A0B1TDJ6_OESDE|nr:F-box domain protein [Oesophagostomum dentatum]